ncbi:MAG: hypothetical protein JW944_01260, partial [Deltaproteobacteria bacterium]|nr:hypothetical protein [Deltaproteobacteria bacterium]
NKNRPHDSDFKKIMEQVSSAFEKKEPFANRENSGPVVNGISILHGTEYIKEPLDVAGKDYMIEELKETLNLVDFYASKLSDSSLPATGLTPLVNHLEDRMETLREIESAPGTPVKLKSIISDMTITIGAEIARFKRGDYV